MKLTFQPTPSGDIEVRFGQQLVAVIEPDENLTFRVVSQHHLDPSLSHVRRPASPTLNAISIRIMRLSA